MKKMFKWCLFVPLFMFSLHVSPQPDFAQENNQKENPADSEEQSRNGLIGQYFVNRNFTNLKLIAPSNGNSLAFRYDDAKDFISKEQTFSAFRWLGYLVSPKTAELTLKLEGIEHYQIEINNTVLTPGKKYSFIKGQLVKVKIESQTNNPQSIKTLEKVQLIGKDNKNTSIIFNSTQLRNPEFRQKEWQQTIKKASRKNVVRSFSQRQQDTDELTESDTDGDQICDSWEEKGYTIRNKVAVPWKEEYGEKGYTKFLSNPFESHTAGDPYTDYEKAARDMPRSNGKETMNPLVAAYPSVNVSLEQVILSKNANLSNSVSSSNSSNWSYTNTEDIGGSFGWSSTQGFNIGVSTRYSHSETVAHQFGTSVENSSHLNSAESAYLNANVRYQNTGSASIYNAKPFVNIVLAKKTIGTIKSRENATALSLLPQGSYPKKGQHGVAINTMDDFSSRAIPLNKEQLKAYMSNKEPIFLETTQVEGQFMIKNTNGEIRLGGDWNGIREEIESKTASIIVNTGEEVKENRIVAKDYSDPEDRNPSLTLKEALKLAYPTEITEGPRGLMYYKDTLVNEESVLAYTDPKTADRIKKQVADTKGPFKDIKTLYDVKLEPGMNFTIKTGFYNDGAERSPYSVDEETWYNTYNILGGKTGLRGYYARNRFAFTELKEYAKAKMKKDSLVYLSLYMKAFNPGKASILLEGKRENIQTTKVDLTNQYKRVIISFNNYRVNPLEYIEVDGDGTNGVSWDNVTLINGKSEDNSYISPPRR